jgi:small GTP-binding protein
MSSLAPFVKVIFIGDSGVGKTCLMGSLLSQKFSEQHFHTTAPEFRPLQLEHRGSLVRLHVWDTAGHEVYRSITRMYFRNAQVVLLCFSVESRDSFDSVEEWRGLAADDAPGARVILVATKCDLLDAGAVSLDEAAAKAAAHGLAAAPTSARTRAGVDGLLELIAEAALELAQAPAAAPAGAPAPAARNAKCC